MSVTTPVPPDIVWLPAGAPQPAGPRFVDNPPERCAPLTVAWAFVLSDGPMNGGFMVNDWPVPPYVTFTTSPFDQQDKWKNYQNQELRELDPTTMIAKFPQARHIYALQNTNFFYWYEYLGWWYST